MLYLQALCSYNELVLIQNCINDGYCYNIQRSGAVGSGLVGLHGPLPPKLLVLDFYHYLNEFCRLFGLEILGLNAERVRRNYDFERVLL